MGLDEKRRKGLVISGSQLGKERLLTIIRLTLNYDYTKPKWGKKKTVAKEIPLDRRGRGIYYSIKGA